MFYEFKHPGLFEYFCKETGNNFSFPLHLHQSFEMILILRGSMLVTVEQKSYEVHRGEGVLIFPYQSHALTSEECEHLLVIFSPELVKSFSASISNQIPEDNRFLLSESLISQCLELEDNSSKYYKKGVLYLVSASARRSERPLNGQGKAV